MSYDRAQVLLSAFVSGRFSGVEQPHKNVGRKRQGVFLQNVGLIDGRVADGGGGGGVAQKHGGYIARHA